MTRTIKFKTRALRPTGETIRLPQAFLDLMADPSALDHVGTVDMDAVYRCPVCGGDGRAGLPEDGDVCPVCLGSGKRQDEETS